MAKEFEDDEEYKGPVFSQGQYAAHKPPYSRWPEDRGHECGRCREWVKPQRWQLWRRDSIAAGQRFRSLDCIVPDIDYKRWSKWLTFAGLDASERIGDDRGPPVNNLIRGPWLQLEKPAPAYQPKPLVVRDHKGKRVKDPTPSANNLATRRWNFHFPDAKTEADCIRRAQAGDMRAFWRVVAAFHKLVLPAAHDKAPKGKYAVLREAPKGKYANVHFEDLVSSGLLGLCDAVRKFDFSRRFSTYARFRIEGEIANEAARQRHGGRRASGKLQSWLLDNLGAEKEEVFAKVQELVAKHELAFSPYQTPDDAQIDIDDALAAFAEPTAFSELDSTDQERGWDRDINDATGDSDDEIIQGRTEALHSFGDLYDACNPDSAPPLDDSDLIFGTWFHARVSDDEPLAPVQCSLPPRGQVLEALIPPSPMWGKDRWRALCAKRKADWPAPRHPFDVAGPYRTERHTVTLKNGKTKRITRHMAASICIHDHFQTEEFKQWQRSLRNAPPIAPKQRGRRKAKTSSTSVPGTPKSQERIKTR